ncbi:hypothetical protein [Peribacillus sp. NPDC096540]|uniref:hypothetical protein n=1 Tax=Peribacillus sp. NPDC096540 TaxID=3390612 RepID=UPI003D03B920
MDKEGGEFKMTVLFGTVEYFEQEMLRHLEICQMGKWTKEDEISLIYSRLENEILFDFVCDEKVRIECLKNLAYADKRLRVKDYQPINDIEKHSLV